MNSLVFLIFACVYSCRMCAQSYKILGVFHFPTRSHYEPMRVVMQRLAEQGHDVSVYSQHPQPKPVANFHDFSIRDCSIFKVKNDASIDNRKDLLDSPLKLSIFDTLLLENFSADSITQCEPLQNLLQSNETFDLLIIETFSYDTFLLVAHKFRVPFINYVLTNMRPWHANRMGNPTNPSYIPTVSSGYVTPMDFWQRVHNLVIHATSLWLHDYFVLKWNDETVKTILGPDSPSIYDITRQASLTLTYTHPSLNPVFPVVPGIIEFGGAHIKSPNPLPENIEKFINQSKHGVVYFCMGSLMRSETFPEEKRNAFLYAFSKIPQRVLWKWEAEDLPGKSDNIMTVKWMPQRDVLAHPNIKLFISHGGLLSSSEAIYEGVPILGIPIFGDQVNNIKTIEANGAGESLYYHSITKEIVLEKVQRILNDPKYKENAKQLSERYRDRPMPPLDAAIYWIEYVIRHKSAPHLRTAAVDMPLYQYLLLDVIAFLLVVIVIILAILYYICKFVFKLIRNRSQKKPVNEAKKEKAY